LNKADSYIKQNASDYPLPALPLASELRSGIAEVMKSVSHAGSGAFLAGCVLLMMIRASRGESGATGKALPAGIAAAGATLQLVADGCDGVPFAFTEGCSSDSAGNVYFTDQPHDRILKYDTTGTMSVFMQPCGRSNGTCFDAAGNIITCADEHNQLWSITPDKKITVLVKDYQGKLLNGPNDVWVDPKGGLYITDPFYKRDYWTRGPMEQDNQSTYFLSADRQTLKRVTDDLKKPNGIIGLANGKRLYVSDIEGGRTYVYDIEPDGSLSHKQLFCEMGSDGMTIDTDGNVYLTNHGVTVFSADGVKFDHIDVKQAWTGNVCFGGSDRRTLFITASKGFYSLRTRVTGAGSQ
jgi:gluconolactonase